MWVIIANESYSRLINFFMISFSILFLNIISSFAPLDFVFMIQTWVLFLCSSFPLLFGVLFNKVCQGFIILMVVYIHLANVKFELRHLALVLR
jgi:hypothetical protein